MKKRYFWLSIMCALLMIFTSCSSTPEETPEEPEVVVPVEPTPEPTPEPTKEPEEPTYDYSAENTALRDSLYAARDAAIEAGAMTLFPEEFLAMDVYSASIDANFEAEKTTDAYKPKAQNILDMYKCFENLSKAAILNDKIIAYDLKQYSSTEDVEKADALADDFNSIESFENINGKYYLEKSEEMLAPYDDIAKTGFKVLSNEARATYITTKKVADEIKASVAAKEEYKAANDLLINADASASRLEWENAYKGYQKANEAMTVVYETVATKRAAAEKAMAEAKARAEAAAAFAVEADEIAPITEEGEAE